MAVLIGDDVNYKRFPSVAAAAEEINAVAERHFFRVSATGRYVKCVRAGKPRTKQTAVNSEPRDRKSHKCDCGLSLRVCFGFLVFLRMSLHLRPVAD